MVYLFLDRWDIFGREGLFNNETSLITQNKTLNDLAIFKIISQESLKRLAHQILQTCCQSESAAFWEYQILLFIRKNGVYSYKVRHLFTKKIFISWISTLFNQSLMYQFLKIGLWYKMLISQTFEYLLKISKTRI